MAQLGGQSNYVSQLSDLLSGLFLSWRAKSVQQHTHMVATSLLTPAEHMVGTCFGAPSVGWAGHATTPWVPLWDANQSMLQSAVGAPECLGPARKAVISCLDKNPNFPQGLET